MPQALEVPSCLRISGQVASRAPNGMNCEQNKSGVVVKRSLVNVLKGFQFTGHFLQTLEKAKYLGISLRRTASQTKASTSIQKLYTQQSPCFLPALLFFPGTHTGFAITIYTSVTQSKTRPCLRSDTTVHKTAPQLTSHKLVSSRASSECKLSDSTCPA